MLTDLTRRPASAERTARRQFQATGPPVSRTQASGAMTSRLPPYEAKCVQRRCFQWGRSLCVQISSEQSYPLPIYYTTRKAIDCATALPLTFLYKQTLQQTFPPLMSKFPKDDKFR